MLSILNLLVLIWVSWSPLGPKKSRVIQIQKIFGDKKDAFCSISKMGEHVENIKFRLDTQLSFMLSTFSPGFFVVYLLEGQPYQGFFTFLSILAYCVAVLSTYLV